MLRTISFFRIIIVLALCLFCFSGTALASDSFAQFLNENASARERYENGTADQQKDMQESWAVLQKRYRSLSPEEKEKARTIRRERKERWDRLSRREESGAHERNENQTRNTYRKRNNSTH